MKIFFRLDFVYDLFGLAFRLFFRYKSKTTIFKIHNAALSGNLIPEITMKKEHRTNIVIAYNITISAKIWCVLCSILTESMIFRFYRFFSLVVKK